MKTLQNVFRTTPGRVITRSQILLFLNIRVNSHFQASVMAILMAVKDMSEQIQKQLTRLKQTLIRKSLKKYLLT